MDEEYRYFIAYRHSEGYGNMEVISPVKIKTLKDIQVLQQKLVDDVKENEGNTIKRVCITNFQLFN